MSKQIDSTAFADKATNAMPKWAWGFLGTFIGVALTLQLTGYNGSLNRVIEAYVKRIEKSADNLEASAAKFDVIIKRLDDNDVQVRNLKVRVDAIERENKAIHKTYHGTK
jgi:hypothetical protein